MWTSTARVLNTRQLRTSGGERTLPVRLRHVALLSLNRAKVIAASRSMIQEVTLAESFLKVLARFALESTLILNWGLHARTQTLRYFASFICRMLVTEHQVMRVNLSAFGRLHQLVSLIDCSTSSRLVLLVMTTRLCRRLRS